MKEIEKTNVNGKITYIHGSVESTISDIHFGENSLDLRCVSGPNYNTTSSRHRQKP